MHYFKPNTKQAIKVAAAIKGLTGAVAASVWATGNPNIAMICFLAGAIANEAINLLSDGTNESPKDDQQPN